MKRLPVRLLISLAAVALIGCVLIDVAFLFWAQSQVSRERQLALRAALFELTVEVDHLGLPSQAALSTMADRHGVILSLVNDAAASSTHRIALPELSPLAPASVVHLGWEHVAMQLPENSPWKLAVASRRVGDTLDVVYDLHSSVVVVLVLVALIMVLLGLLFLRRVVLGPIGRLTDLVGREDRDALFRLGAENRDDFGQLSRAIIAMTQRIEDDRRQIGEQLAEIRVAKASLEATQHQLIRAERLSVVGQLAAGIAHEVGNPLAILSGYVEILGDQKLANSDRQEALTRMAMELDRIQETVRNLLDFSRTPPAEGTISDVREAVLQVQGLLAAHKAMRQVACEVDLPNVSLRVTVGNNALTQILLNLLLNAGHAAGQGGRMRVRVHAVDGNVQIDVDDSGPGVSPPMRKRIFEPFFTTKPPGSGTGLGLAVCERIVDAAGGDLTVHDSKLGGALFRVTLPQLGAPNHQD